MAWERRPSGRFYYRSVREGRAVRKEYVGCGLAGQLAAEFDAQERVRRVEARDADRAANLADDEADAPLRQLERECERQVRAALGAAGFHRPKRGKWRKHRGKEKSEG